MSHTKRIATRPINPQLQSALQAAGANPLIAQLYAARNVADSSELNTSLKQLIPYTQLTNCTAAASRLRCRRRHRVQRCHERAGEHGRGGGFFCAQPL